MKLNLSKIHLGIQQKITILNVIVPLVTFIIISILVIRGTQTLGERILINNLQHTADLSVISLRQSLLAYDNSTSIEDVLVKQANTLAAALSNENQMGVLIFSKNKALLGRSPRYSSITSDFTELEEVLKGNRTYVIRSDRTGRLMCFSIPLLRSGNFAGIIMLISPMNELDQLSNNLQIYVFVCFLAGLAILFIVSFFMSKRIIQPLIHLKNSALNIAKGNYKDRIEVSTSDEISELAKAFNMMTIEIEKKINMLNDEKEKQKQFFTSASHELKTPLTTIQGYVELLRERSKDQKILDTSLPYIHSACERLNHLVTDLLDLSCMSKQEFEIVLSKANISELISDIAGQMSLKAKKFNMSININELPSIDTILDPSRFKQAIVNIIDNAIKYSHGTEISITVCIEHNTISIAIADNGIGIPKDYLDKIFEPFYRIDTSRSRNMGGNGLGLSITREIIEKHGGTINIESELEKGTSVIIKLPCTTKGTHTTKGTEVLV